MITVGIDSGSQNTKAVALLDGKVAGKAKLPTEFDINRAAEQVYGTILSMVGFNKEEVRAVVATGAGRGRVEAADARINEILSAAKGAKHIETAACVIIDIGAETARIIRLNSDGTINGYETNDKCASGTGVFIESIARLLQINIEEMGTYSLRHSKELPMHAQCVVFAESEVISLIHQRESKEDIAYGVHKGISGRICSMASRTGVNGNIVFIGGLGRNTGLVDCLKKEIGHDISVPEDPEYVSALGAALHGALI